MPIQTKRPALWALVYIGVGVVFGFALIKGEMASWYRIQEMFRFQSFHMYGLMFSAVFVAAASVALLRRSHLKALTGEDIVIPGKPLGRGVRYAVGGLLFGLGWGLGGTCPGPIFALMGNAIPGAFVVFASAFLGTFAYSRLQPRLPH
jgi:uncharacterized membrane protein YedE/YeeE